MEPGLSSFLTESDRPTHSGGKILARQRLTPGRGDPCTQWSRPGALGFPLSPRINSVQERTLEILRRALLTPVVGTPVEILRCAQDDRNPTPPVLLGLRSTGCVGSLGRSESVN